MGIVRYVPIPKNFKVKPYGPIIIDEVMNNFPDLSRVNKDRLL